jgi:gamma-tubulin complex component 2
MYAHKFKTITSIPSSKEIVDGQIHSKLMTTCTMFASYTPQLARSLQTTDPGLLSGGSDDSKNPPDLARLKKLDDVLNKYEENFSHHLKILVDALNYYAATESVALLGLVSNLDWNRDWGMTS